MRNKPTALLALLVMMNFATRAWCVSPAPFSPPPDALQVRYAANLNIGESYIDITNGGTVGGTDPGGNICVNVYTFDPGEEMVACCSCLVTPDQTVNLGVNRDLTVKTLTGVVPTSVTVKLVASKPSKQGLSCTNSAAVAAPTLVSGMLAWGTTLHATPTAGVYATTETQFALTQLSASELSQLTGTCQSIISNGSGFGICNSCRAGAL